MMNNIGLYVHIPFCRSKCPYCDFYSFRADDDTKERYVNAVTEKIKKSFAILNCKADTLYIGGGTPSVLSAEQLKPIINQATSTFLTEDAEITVECNPYKLNGDFIKSSAECKVNRLSVGLQSANDDERKILGRRAKKDNVLNVVQMARETGIENISLDVMLGIPGETLESFKNTLQFCVDSGVPHLSCYILKLEENTPFYKMQNTLNLPDDDETADMYLFMCDFLKENGFVHYEISNFAKPGFESRHNLKYWHDEEYLGIGAAAHSFLNGKRTYYPRDIDYFIDDKEPLFESDGGDFDEFSMLRLRLTEGLTESAVKERFGFKIPDEMRKKAEPMSKNGLLEIDDNKISLTEKGFLLSNSVISELIL